ncbi:hypothetical protein GGR22_002473 [Flavobacterium gossypii]|uniref:Uncharacterized protein n=1 Tax=Flavobacterium gossypii TaxID=1646119 RepID=A0ABR6DRJ1_9FLAO|nr:hypothetical protein [Flavobacterium gossypii]
MPPSAAIVSAWLFFTSDALFITLLLKEINRDKYNYYDKK